MDPINTTLLRRVIRLLEKIERGSHQPAEQTPKAVGKDEAANQERNPTPFLVSDRAEITVHPELVAEWRSNQNQEEREHRKSVRLQWALFFVTLGAFVAAAWYARTAQKQLNVSIRALDLQSRPWVAVGSVTVLAIKPDRSGLTVNVNIRNLGTVPAFHVVPFLLSYSGDPDMITAYDRFKHMSESWCEFADGMRLRGGTWSFGKDNQGVAQTLEMPRGLGFNIFPGNFVTLTQALNVPFGAKRSGLFGCISYTDQLGTANHHTGICFQSASTVVALDESMGVCPVYQRTD